MQVGQPGGGTGEGAGQAIIGHASPAVQGGGHGEHDTVEPLGHGAGQTIIAAPFAVARGGHDGHVDGTLELDASSTHGGGQMGAVVEPGLAQGTGQMTAGGAVPGLEVPALALATHGAGQGTAGQAMSGAQVGGEGQGGTVHVEASGHGGAHGRGLTTVEVVRVRLVAGLRSGLCRLFDRA